MTQEQRKVLEVYRQMWMHTGAEEPVAVDAALAEIDELRKTNERLRNKIAGIQQLADTKAGLWRTDDPPKDRPFLAEREPEPWVVRRDSGDSWAHGEECFCSIPAGYKLKVTRWMDIPEAPCRS